ncbi:hypothetical protein O6H91_17G021600 [Diphasiastrum complanatum]|uniref:Uncharacterized protein n=1 Tax=Diphasiastrum complanatum TaxID=34168 RepID=A0ACC2B4T3_DIPCM|nr:hypothetical protein O6H91_17G021600 [Diphasiastrum complanatum]
MVSLKLQKRLAASVLQCGQCKVWLHLNEVNEIFTANSRQNIQKLVKDGFLIRNPTKVHLRHVPHMLWRQRDRVDTGRQKRRGTWEAQLPTKVKAHQD